MPIIVGCPVLEQHDLTRQLIQSITDTLANPADFHLILIDNNSTVPYKAEDYVVPFTLTVKHNDTNEGFYLPMQWMYEQFGANHILGMIHNDILFYEKAWDNRLRYVFSADPELGLVGLCGSNVADPFGGRGIGTVCNFRGEKGGIAGPKRDELVPCVLIDSLAMFFRGSVIPMLKIDSEITPCHFYDKIWSMRMVENRQHVAMLGIEIDHMGGNTSCSSSYQEDAKRWCREHGVPLEVQEGGNESGDLALYHEGERRFLSEYRDQKKIIPCRIDAGYKLWKV